MLHVSQSSYPYSHFWANKENDISLCERLHELLPHGSGINGSWHIERNKRNKLFYAHNDYESMNESGMYCHVYDFTVIYKYHGLNAYKPCEYCNGTGKRFITDICDRTGEFPMQVIERIVSNGAEVFWNELGNAYSTYFTCVVCHGNAKVLLPEFEFIRLNFHGQKEYSCCGYNLKEYLSDTLSDLRL